MSIFKKRKILVTHNGSFHSDDVFACATLILVLEKNNEIYKVVRTRDEKIINMADYVFDVGGIYNPTSFRFDHHQKGGAENRENNISYSSFGLVWKHFGLDLCGSDMDVWRAIEDKIVVPIDAIDNGIDIIVPKFEKIVPYYLDQEFLVYSPTWEESNADIDEIFLTQVKKIKLLLEREIIVAKSEVKAKKIIKDAYENAVDKRIIQLDNSFPRFIFQRVLSAYPEPVYLVYPSGHSSIWKVETIRKNFHTMESRKPLPENWWGYLDGDPKLKEITGVSDVLFCHKNGFLTMAASREGAIKLAELALNK